MDNRQVLVAGGGGFLGSHLCERLVAEGAKVTCVDNFESGRKRNIKHLLTKERFTLFNADIRSCVDYPEVDEIYHLASRASPTDFTEYPVDIALTNTVGTRNLLNHAVETDAKMVFASTSEVYGNPEVHPQPESYNGNVNIRGPRGCYDEAKRFGETLTVAYVNEYDLDVRTARIFNSYGPRMRPNDGRVIPTFMTQALRGENLTVYGEGTQTRSFCFAADTVSALCELMNKDGLQGKVVNIGKENEISINELADSVLNVVDTGSNIVHEPLPEDDPERRCPDLTRARELLDWEPEVPLQAGLEKSKEYFETVLAKDT